MTETQHAVISRALYSDPKQEQMTFLTTEAHSTPAGLVLIVRTIMPAGEGDLEDQSPVSVRPSLQYQRRAYDLASATGEGLADIHTHTHAGAPRLSAIDTRHGSVNARVIRKYLGTGFLMLATGNDGRGFDGVYYTSEGQLVPINEMVIVGRSIRRIHRRVTLPSAEVEVSSSSEHAPQRTVARRLPAANLMTGGRRLTHALVRSSQVRWCGLQERSTAGSSGKSSRVSRPLAPAASNNQTTDRFDRQRRLPSWDQESLERARIAFVGAGGNGSHAFQLTVLAGGGRRGHIVLIDHDRVESSNLNRIPYATMADLGRWKVDVAASYARRSDPIYPVQVVRSRVESEEAIRALWAADIIFGCGDNDGVRALLNRHALNAASAYIDLGCGVRLEPTGTHCGGQVAVVTPGTGGCLRCNGLYDPSVAHAELDPTMREHRRRAGYAQGLELDPEPAIVGLNSLAASIAFWQLLALVRAAPIRWGELTAFEAGTGDFTKCSLTVDPHCQDCGSPSPRACPVEQAWGLSGVGEANSECEG